MFITVVDYDMVVKDNMIDLSIFGKKAHQRKNEEGKAKVDFSMNVYSAQGIDAGVTFEYDFKNPCDEALATLPPEKTVMNNIYDFFYAQFIRSMV